MINNEIQKLTDKLFKSRQNCLLLNASEKFEHNTRLDFSILSKLFPFFPISKPFQDETIYTLICTSHINKDYVDLGDVQNSKLGFKQVFFLVRSKTLNSLNISLLRTTLSTTSMLGEVLKDFDCTTFLLFSPWRTNVFDTSIKEAMGDTPYTVALMDGFGHNSDSEKETRPKEINDEVSKFKKDGFKCMVVNKRFSIYQLSYLMSNKSNLREVQRKGLIKRAETISHFFDANFMGNNLWREIVLDTFSKSRIDRKYEYTSDNIVKYCVIPSMNTLLSKQEFVLFEKLVPKWKEHLERSLNEYSSKPVPKDRIEDILKNKIGKRFTDYVVNQLNMYFRHD